MINTSKKFNSLSVLAERLSLLSACTNPAGDDYFDSKSKVGPILRNLHMILGQINLYLKKMEKSTHSAKFYLLSQGHLSLEELLDLHSKAEKVQEKVLRAKFRNLFKFSHPDKLNEGSMVKCFQTIFPIKETVIYDDAALKQFFKTQIPGALLPQTNLEIVRELLKQEFRQLQKYAGKDS